MATRRSITSFSEERRARLHHPVEQFLAKIALDLLRSRLDPFLGRRRLEDFADALPELAADLVRAPVDIIVR
jgi:hypothetical protein